MAQRFLCRWCGNGFLSKPWEKNGMANTCKRAKCEKLSAIYSKPQPMTPSEMGKRSASNMTKEERKARAKKASLAARKKYGKDRMKKVRSGKTFKRV
jgi:hypothetical protein